MNRQALSIGAEVSVRFWKKPDTYSPSPSFKPQQTGIREF